ncbi:MAG TPA: extracellular solute-binding protein [Candidatus Binatia bacterium]|nr:extracellular solute-binding protein [Candidatus Binatia bacterium]
MFEHSFVKAAFALFICVVSALWSSNNIRAWEADPRLVEAARREGGEILVYSTIRVDETKLFWDRLKSKYPFVRVNQYRAGTNRMVERLMAEQRAGKYFADVITMGDDFLLTVLTGAGVVSRYDSPQAKNFANMFRDPQGRWTTIFIVPLTIAYNSRLVPANEAPKSWRDLLNPKWKDKIAMESDHLVWYAGILKALGSEKGRQFMTALSKQTIRLVGGASIGMNLLAAGEFPIFLSRANQTEIFKVRGAPVDWIKDPDPLLSQFHAAGMAKNAPHPSSAKLLLEFLLSEEAAEIIAQGQRVPSRRGVMKEQLSPGFREIHMDKMVPPQRDDLMVNQKKYLEEFQSLFGKGD